MQLMKNVLITIIVLVLAGAAGFFYLQNNKSTTISANPTPTQIVQATPSEEEAGYCTPSQLEAKLDPEVAAGNYYGAITIKNISQSTCQIIGNNSLEVGYPMSVENFQTVNKDKPSTSIFTLTPNQTIYSLIHFPNGPQCSSEAVQVDAMVSYDISDEDSISFKPTMGDTVLIPSCGEESEMTDIGLYSFSNQEVQP